MQAEIKKKYQFYSRGAVCPLKSDYLWFMFVFVRGRSFIFNDFKLPVKIRQVIEATVETNLGHVHFVFHQ